MNQIKKNKQVEAEYCFPSYETNEIKEAFDCFDINRNGYIGVAELREIFSIIQEDVSDEELDEMIKMADKEGDGQVNWLNFFEFITGNGINQEINKINYIANENIKESEQSSSNYQILGEKTLKRNNIISIKGTDEFHNDQVIRAKEVPNPEIIRKKNIVIKRKDSNEELGEEVEILAKSNNNYNPYLLSNNNMFKPLKVTINNDDSIEDSHRPKSPSKENHVASMLKRNQDKQREVKMIDIDNKPKPKMIVLKNVINNENDLMTKKDEENQLKINVEEMKKNLFQKIKADHEDFNLDDSLSRSKSSDHNHIVSGRGFKHHYTGAFKESYSIIDNKKDPYIDKLDNQEQLNKSYEEHIKVIQKKINQQGNSFISHHSKFNATNNKSKSKDKSGESEIRLDNNVKIITVESNKSDQNSNTPQSDDIKFIKIDQLHKQEQLNIDKNNNTKDDDNKKDNKESSISKVKNESIRQNDNENENKHFDEFEDEELEEEYIGEEIAIQSNKNESKIKIEERSSKAKGTISQKDDLSKIDLEEEGEKLRKDNEIKEIEHISYRQDNNERKELKRKNEINSKTQMQDTKSSHSTNCIKKYQSEFSENNDENGNDKDQDSLPSNIQSELAKKKIEHSPSIYITESQNAQSQKIYNSNLNNNQNNNINNEEEEWEIEEYDYSSPTSNKNKILFPIKENIVPLPIPTINTKQSDHKRSISSKPKEDKDKEKEKKTESSKLSDKSINIIRQKGNHKSSQSSSIEHSKPLHKPFNSQEKDLDIIIVNSQHNDSNHKSSSYKSSYYSSNSQKKNKPHLTQKGQFPKFKKDTIKNFIEKEQITPAIIRSFYSKFEAQSILYSNLPREEFFTLFEFSQSKEGNDFFETFRTIHIDEHVISIIDILILLLNGTNLHKEEKFKFSFLCFDKDKTNFLSKEELSHMLELNYLTVTTSEINKRFQLIVDEIKRMNIYDSEVYDYDVLIEILKQKPNLFFPY